MATSQKPNGEVGGVERSPEPMGAKQTVPDPRVQWRTERARLGGYEDPVAFTELQQEILNTAADLIIPAGGGFPPPSEVGVVEFMSRYVTPADHEVKYFPLAGEFAFKDRVNALGEEFLAALPSAQTAALAALEASEDEGEATFFEQLRGLVYYGYYARPEVTAAIRRNLAGAADYHGPPLPYGYAHVEGWPEEMLDHGRGSYVATDDVTRIDIPDDLKEEYGVQS